MPESSIHALSGCLFRRFMLGLLAILPAFLFSTSYALSAHDAPASPSRTLRIPWGDTEQACGLLTGPEMETGGPLSFALETPPDTLILLDSVHQSVKRLDLSTAHLRTLAKGVRATSIASAPGDSFLLREGDSISLWDSGAKATRQASAPLAPHLARFDGYGIELWKDSADAVWLQTLDQRSHPVARPSQSAQGARRMSLLPRPAAFDTAHPGNLPPGRTAASPTREQLRYFIKPFDADERRLLGQTPEGKELFSARLVPAHPGATIATVLFRGADAQGRLYVEMETLAPGGRPQLEVHCFAPDGQPLNVIPIANDYFTTVYKKTEVLPGGGIIQMLATPDGIEFRLFGGAQ